MPNPCARIRPRYFRAEALLVPTEALPPRSRGSSLCRRNPARRNPAATETLLAVNPAPRTPAPPAAASRSPAAGPEALLLRRSSSPKAWPSAFWAPGWRPKESWRGFVEDRRDDVRRLVVGGRAAQRRAQVEAGALRRRLGGGVEDADVHLAARVAVARSPRGPEIARVALLAGQGCAVRRLVEVVAVGRGRLLRDHRVAAEDVELLRLAQCLGAARARGAARGGAGVGVGVALLRHAEAATHQDPDSAGPGPGLRAAGRRRLHRGHHRTLNAPAVHRAATRRRRGPRAPFGGWSRNPDPGGTAGPPGAPAGRGRIGRAGRFADSGPCGPPGAPGHRDRRVHRGRRDHRDRPPGPPGPGPDPGCSGPPNRAARIPAVPHPHPAGRRDRPDHPARPARQVRQARRGPPGPARPPRPRGPVARPRELDLVVEHQPAELGGRRVVVGRAAARRELALERRPPGAFTPEIVGTGHRGFLDPVVPYHGSYPAPVPRVPLVSGGSRSRGRCQVSLVEAARKPGRAYAAPDRVD